MKCLLFFLWFVVIWFVLPGSWPLWGQGAASKDAALRARGALLPVGMPPELAPGLGTQDRTELGYLAPDFLPYMRTPEVPPGFEQSQVQAAIRAHTTANSRAWLVRMQQRSHLYEYFIVREIQARGLPEFLQWVVLIESEYVPRALSRAGARGLWQFMENSIGSAMRINEYMDERQDFMKATRAALSKLEYNYSRTKDWYLALAAYNAGLGRVERLQASHPGADFWYLARHRLLPAETIAYVPKLLAVSWLLSNPVRNGLSYSWISPRQWTELTLEPGQNLEVLSRRMWIPYEIIRAGNAELLQSETPPAELQWKLKLPLEYADVFSKRDFSP